MALLRGSVEIVLGNNYVGRLGLGESCYWIETKCCAEIVSMKL